MKRLTFACALVVALLAVGSSSQKAFAHQSSVSVMHTQSDGNGNNNDTGDENDNSGNNENNGDEDGNGGHGGGGHFVSYPAYTTTDNGSCSQPWATDTIHPSYNVHKNSDGTYTVTKLYRGTFVTTGPVSPGKCDNTNTPHGSVVGPGYKGRLVGYLSGVVTGGTYNPHGCDATPSACSTTGGFIAATFPGGTYSCSVGYPNCSFDFRYHSGDPALKYHYWRDASQNSTTTPEIFQGDIANA